MLHELIFVLSGYSGDFFVPFPAHPEKPSTFVVSNDFPLLHQAERESLNRLGQLGWTFAQLSEFVESVKQQNEIAKSSKLCGSYMQAAVTALESTLDNYRRDILLLEQNILNKHHEAGAGVVPLSLLTSTLGSWQLLLPLLNGFVQKLKESVTTHYGCRLLDLVLSEAQTGNDAYRDVMENMAIHLHDVLYRQLTAWMVYGQLTDPNQEFFITRDQERVSGAGWQRHYALVHDRIPSHIPQTLADSILFVGKAIATVELMDGDTSSVYLKRSRQTTSVPQDIQREHLKLMLSLHSSQAVSGSSLWKTYPMKLQQVVHSIRRSTADWLFSQVLIGEHSLERYLFSFRAVFLLGYGDLALNFVTICRDWQPIHSRDRAPHTLPSADATTSRGRKTEMIFRHQEINAMLNRASVGTEDEEALTGYSIHLFQGDSAEAPPKFSNLLLADTSCTLTYEMRWPIDLFLSSTDIRRYSELWSFLIALRNVQHILCNLWQAIQVDEWKQEQHVDPPARRARYIEDEDPATHERVMWRLRANMLHWVSTLWNHVQTNVIHPHYRRLMETMPLTNQEEIPLRWSSSDQPKMLDFEELQEAHNAYLRGITRGCLLSSQNCSETVYRILTTCIGFCALVEQVGKDGKWQRNKRRKTAKTAADIVEAWTRDLENEHAQPEWVKQMATMEETFVSMSDLFFGLVASQPQEVKGSGNLDMLLMQLDYNKWYSGKQL